jgi:hypothetical protein
MKHLSFLLLVIWLAGKSSALADENPFASSSLAVTSGEVSLPLQEWQTVWKAASQASPKSAKKPTVAVALQSAIYSARLEGSLLRCEAVFRLRSFTDDWHTLLLVGGEWNVEALDLPEGIAILRDASGLSVVWEGKANHEIKLPLSLPMTGGAAKVKLIPAPAQRFTLTEIDPSRVLKLNGQLPFRAEGKPSTYVLPAVSGDVTLQLEDAAPAVVDTKLPRYETAQATITKATASTWLVADGSVLHELAYELTHRGTSTWTVPLPDGATLLACQVNGQDERPVQRAPQQLEFPLTGKSSSSTTSKVSLTYHLKLKAWDRVSGEAALVLPKTKLFTQALHWQVELPEGYEIMATEGSVSNTAAANGASVRTAAFKKELFANEAPEVALFYQRIDLGE